MKSLEEKISKIPVHLFSLHFKDKTISDEYIEYCFPIKRIMILVLGVYSILGITKFSSRTDLSQYLQYLFVGLEIAKIIFSIIIFFKYKGKHLHLIISGLILLHTLSIIDNYLTSNREIIFGLVLMYGVIMINYFPPLNWYANSLIVLLSHIYISIRSEYHIQDEFGNKYSHNSISIIAMSVHFMALFYINEIIKKCLFYKTRISERQNMQYKDIIENHISNPLFIFDEQSKTIYFQNKAGESMVSELGFSSIFELLSLNHLLKGISQISLNKFGFIIKAHEITDYLIGTSLPYLWSKNKKSIIFVIEKLTQQVIIMRGLQELDRYKNLLLSSVSHDLRTPLSGVISTVLVLKEKTRSTIKKGSYSLMLSSLKLLNFMVHDLLDFGLFNNGNSKFKLTEDYITLNNLVKELRELFINQLKGKNIRLDFIVEVNRKISFLVDSNRLKQVLINLISNSLKFTKIGYIQVRISEEFMLLKSYLSFSVVDTGIGIKPEGLKRIFKLFGKIDQEDSSINRHGIGLGLYISQYLATMLFKNESSIPNENAGIKVLSSFGIGTTMKFLIPFIKKPSLEIWNNGLKHNKTFDNFELKKGQLTVTSRIRSDTPLNRIYRIDSNNEDEEISLLKFEYKSNSSVEIKKIKITDFNLLLVEDDPTNNYAIKCLLKTKFENVDACYNGEECIRKINSNPFKYDLIFMDCNMPIMNGFMASKNIRKLCGEGKIKIPVIIGLSANTQSCRNACIDSGMNNLIEKPFTILMLDEIIENYLIKKEGVN